MGAHRSRRGAVSASNAIRRSPGRGGVLATLAAACAVMLAAAPASARPSHRPATEANRGTLQMYYRSKILVRTGERIRIPVDVACATAEGRACGATVALGATGPSGKWGETAARARPDLQFALTGPASRAARAGGARVVAYSLRAEGGGRTISYPPAGRGSLRLYVAATMRRIRFHATRFGSTRPGKVVLSLRWGTGPRRAGLSPGNQSATIGPSSFDVDRRGRIHLLDPLQGRIAVFDGPRLVRQVRTPLTPASDLAVAGDGTTFVATQRAGIVTAEALTPSGRIRDRWRLGRGILAEVRAAGHRGFVHLLPLDAWIRLGPGPGGSASGAPQRSGSLLLSSVVGRNIRLGLARTDRVTRAIELHPSHEIGELALAARDGDGYLTVFRVVRKGPTPAEQFQG